MLIENSLALVFILLSSSLVLSTSTSTSNTPFKRIYAFGDSFTDTGNTKTSTGPTAFNYVSNPPYGETFFHRPTNRYSDGRIMIDFVAEALSLPFTPPYRDPTADKTHGVNFAVGGATAIRHGFFTKNNVTFNLVGQSLQTQLVWFNKISNGCKDMKSSPRECRAVLGDDALVWLGEIGANDYTCTTGSSIPPKTIQKIAIKSTIGFLKAMLDKGAKYIVVQGLPMTGCSTYSFVLSSPDDRDAIGCVGSMTRMAYSHNLALQTQLTLLRKQYPQSVIAYLDYYNMHRMVFMNAGKFGFKEQYKACCGYGGGEYNFDVFNPCGTPSSSACSDPSQYINWDGAHFTEAVYKVMANSVLNGSHCTPSFPSLLKKRLQTA